MNTDAVKPTAGRQGSITISDDNVDMVIRQCFAREQIWMMVGAVAAFTTLAALILCVFVFDPSISLTRAEVRPILIVLVPMLIGIAFVIRDASRSREVRVSHNQLTFRFKNVRESWPGHRIVAFTIELARPSFWVGRHLIMHLRDGQVVPLFTGSERELAYAREWLEAAVGVIPDALHLSAYPKPPVGSEGEVRVYATGIDINFAPRRLWWPAVTISTLLSFGGVAALSIQEHDSISLRFVQASLPFQVIGAICFSLLIGSILHHVWRATRPTSRITLWGNSLEIAEGGFRSGSTVRTLAVHDVDHSTAEQSALAFHLRDGQTVTALAGRSSDDARWANECLLTFLHLYGYGEPDAEAENDADN